MDLIFIISVMVIWFIVDHVLRKRFGIDKESARKNRRLTSRQLFYFLVVYSVLFLGSSIFWRSGLQIYLLLVLMSALFGYQAFLQWRDEKITSKYYIRSLFTSLIYLVLFIGLVSIVYPREFQNTFETVMYSSNSDEEDQITIEIQGQTWLNLLYGKTFFGTLQVGDNEFLVLQYQEEPNEIPIIDRLRGTYRQYTLIELGGGQRGKVWLSRDLASFAGTFSRHTFAHPAKTEDDVQNLLLEVK